VTDTPAPAVQVTDLVHRWPGPRHGPGAFTLRLPDFRLAQGERVLMLGASGSGKSTLLSLICGVSVATTGTVTVAGTDLARLSPRARDRFRADRIGVIFQQFNLLPWATGLDNIVLPLTFSPARRARTPDPRVEALRLAAALGLDPALMTRGPARALSVGQQQRVAVARALIGGPGLIVADEPTSALDAGSQAAFLDLLTAQVAAQGASLLMVSHDDRLGARFDRVVQLDRMLAA
jgi:putative ABC transport system ATP-binding protein